MKSLADKKMTLIAKDHPPRSMLLKQARRTAKVLSRSTRVVTQAREDTQVVKILLTMTTSPRAQKMRKKLRMSRRTSNSSQIFSSTTTLSCFRT